MVSKRNITKLLTGLCMAMLTAIIIPSLYAADQLVWQLGKANGSSREFSPAYRAWEYGNSPAIQKSLSMNHKTHTFSYEIKDNKVIASPPIVSGLTGEWMRSYMKPDELVSGVKITWYEPQSGNRKLELGLVNWRNLENGKKGPVYKILKEGIDILLPDGTKRVFYLPAGKAEKGATQKYTMVFPVKAGKNTVVVRVKSKARHYLFSFDYLSLFTTNAVPDASPILESYCNSQNGIYHPGQNAILKVKAFNLPKGRATIKYSIVDAFGKKLNSGMVGLKDCTASIKLPSDKKGWFKVETVLDKVAVLSSYVVIEPVTSKYVDQSRFGCHAFLGDGYRSRFWPEMQEENMRKAFLAGAKWARYHRLSWLLTEPEKGKFFWDIIDKKLDIADKYKIRTMFNLGDTPRWASARPDETKLTICGTPRYSQYPPVNYGDWSDFIYALVSRYKSRVKWYELWNEPGGNSAFWCNGSAKDYGILLKTAYQAMKNADPTCTALSGAPLNEAIPFFEEMVKSTGGKLYFDVMSLHYLNNVECGAAIFKRWKYVMDKLGGNKIPYVNSEEMGWGKDSSMLGSAAKLIKIYVREASQGIVKTFVFDFFRNGSWHNASAFDYSGSPLPQYAAYRTMTHRLEYANYVGDLSNSELEAYLFNRNGTPVIVLWSKIKHKIDLPFGTTDVKVINIMDMASNCIVKNGKLQITVSPVPQFIEGGMPGLLKAYANIIQGLAHETAICPGETIKCGIRLGQATDVKLQIPATWTGEIKQNQLTLSVPKNTPAGMYEAQISFSLNNIALKIPFPIEVGNGLTGENLIKNGDFSKGTAYWFYPKEKKRFDCIKRTGIDGENAARARGTVYFGCAGKIKVRAGERYALIAEAKGNGHFGGVIYIFDENGKKLYPQKTGINCLVGKAGPEWKKFYEEITITQPKADHLKFSILANHKYETGNICFNRFAIVRLSDRLTLNKAVYQGVYERTSGMPVDWNKIPAMKVGFDNNVVTSKGVKWSGPDDLCASCRLAMDSKYLYLRFEVKDDKFCPVGKIDDRWKYHGYKFDSIQFAIDPAMNGKDRTEILIAEDKDGKVASYKYSNFWTPELPENITLNGLMKDVKIELKKRQGRVSYTIVVPLYELYPLTAKANEFGFSWLVNDNDGQGRKYIQWSSGIGPEKQPGLFGLVKTR